MNINQFLCSYIAGAAVARLRRYLCKVQLRKAFKDVEMAQTARRQIQMLQKLTTKDTDDLDQSSLTETQVRQRTGCHLTNVTEPFTQFWYTLWELVSGFYQEENLRATTPQRAQSEALRKADLKQQFAQLFEEASDSDISGISIYIHDIWL